MHWKFYFNVRYLIKTQPNRLKPWQSLKFFLDVIQSEILPKAELASMFV